LKTAGIRGAAESLPRKGAAFFRSLIRLGIAGALLSAVWGFGQAPKDASSYEYDVKAVFLFNFTRYLEWPEDRGSEAFTIVVLGESGIVAPLQEIARKKTVGAKPIVVRSCSEIGQIGRPQMLFIARSAGASLPRILAFVRGAEILTIGEEEGLGARGLAVNFVVRDGAIRFEMNEKVLKEARIQTGSQLLKLAILVGDETARDGK
jgi:hypothetical protein